MHAACLRYTVHLNSLVPGYPLLTRVRCQLCRLTVSVAPGHTWLHVIYAVCTLPVALYCYARHKHSTAPAAGGAIFVL